MTHQSFLLISEQLVFLRGDFIDITPKRVTFLSNHCFRFYSPVPNKPWHNIPVPTSPFTSSLGCILTSLATLLTSTREALLTHFLCGPLDMAVHEKLNLLLSEILKPCTHSHALFSHLSHICPIQMHKI